MMSTVCYSGPYGADKDVVGKKCIDVEISGDSILNRSGASQSSVLLPKSAANSLKKHCWGAFRVLPKTSGLPTKVRLSVVIVLTVLNPCLGSLALSFSGSVPRSFLVMNLFFPSLL